MKFGKLTGYQLSGQKLLLDFEGQAASVEAVAPGIINVFCGLETSDHRSKAIEGNKRLPVSLEVSKEGDCLRSLSA